MYVSHHGSTASKRFSPLIPLTANRVAIKGPQIKLVMCRVTALLGHKFGRVLSYFISSANKSMMAGRPCDRKRKLL